MSNEQSESTYVVVLLVDGSGALGLAVVRIAAVQGEVLHWHIFGLEKSKGNFATTVQHITLNGECSS